MPFECLSIFACVHAFVMSCFQFFGAFRGAGLKVKLGLVMPCTVFIAIVLCSLWYAGSLWTATNLTEWDQPLELAVSAATVTSLVAQASPPPRRVIVAKRCASIGASR